LATHYNVKTVTDGLVLALDAANPKSYSGSGATTWRDLSGNSNTGTLVNSPTYNAANGGYLSFNGSNQYSTVSNNITSGTGDFAVSIWVYKTEIVANRYLWDFGSNGGTLSSGTGDGPGFRYYNPTIGIGSPLYTSGPIHNINTWYNIVISRISGTTYFYSNGSLIVSAADSGNIGSWGTALRIGGYGGGGGYYHQGNISNLLVYKNKGLTAAEVLQNYNALKSRYIAAPSIPTPTPPASPIVTSGLVLNLDAGNTASYSGGNTWTDLSGSNNNGTLTGSPTYNAANGGKLVFNGSNYVTVSSLNLSTTNHTIIAVARYTGASNLRIISSNGVNWLMGWWGGQSNKYYANGWVSASSGGTAETSWIFYAATGDYSADSWTLYRNGITIVAGPNNSGSNGPNGLVIGGDGSENSACEVGVVLVYNRVLTTTEITQNFEALRGRYGL
jgi:hypothetical protein